MEKVFITGGTSGIGLELAKLYKECGFEVAVCGRDLTKLKEDIKSYQVDVTDREGLHNAINDFSQGKLDVLIANAGIGVGDKPKTPNFIAAKRVFDINVMGVLYTFEAGFEIMKKQGSGRLVAIASVAGLAGLPGTAAYSASKAAVLKMCESYNLDFKSSNISVTAIGPGFIDTPLTQRNDHPMPFLMSAEKGAQKIKNAIDMRKALYFFPWQMAFVMLFMEKIPRFIYRWLMRSKLFNYSS